MSDGAVGQMRISDLFDVVRGAVEAMTKREAQAFEEIERWVERTLETSKLREELIEHQNREMRRLKAAAKEVSEPFIVGTPEPGSLFMRAGEVPTVEPVQGDRQAVDMPALLRRMDIAEANGRSQADDLTTLRARVRLLEDRVGVVRKGEET